MIIKKVGAIPDDLELVSACNAKSKVFILARDKETNNLNLYFHVNEKSLPSDNWILVLESVPWSEDDAMVGSFGSNDLMVFSSDLLMMWVIPEITFDRPLIKDNIFVEDIDLTDLCPDFSQTVIVSHCVKFNTLLFLTEDNTEQHLVSCIYDGSTEDPFEWNIITTGRELIDYKTLSVFPPDFYGLDTDLLFNKFSEDNKIDMDNFGILLGVSMSHELSRLALAVRLFDLDFSKDKEVISGFKALFPFKVSEGTIPMVFESSIVLTNVHADMGISDISLMKANATIEFRFNGATVIPVSGLFTPYLPQNPIVVNMGFNTKLLIGENKIYMVTTSEEEININIVKNDF
jgi:hypothetical protein